MSRFALISFITVVLLLPGCGSDSEVSDPGVSPAAAETANDAETDSGAESNGGEGDAVEIPSDFAIPTVEGAVLVIDSLPGIPDGAYLQLLYPGDRYDELVEFYDSWVSEQPAEWSPTPSDTSGGVGWFSFALEGEPGYGQSVTIAPPSDSDGRTAVSLVAESDDS